jgi:hypothetical protein
MNKFKKEKHINELFFFFCGWFQGKIGEHKKKNWPDGISLNEMHKHTYIYIFISFGLWDKRSNAHVFSLSPVSHSGTNINQPNEEKEINKNTRDPSLVHMQTGNTTKNSATSWFYKQALHTHTQREPQTVAINYSETGS